MSRRPDQIADAIDFTEWTFSLTCKASVVTIHQTCDLLGAGPYCSLPGDSITE